MESLLRRRPNKKASTARSTARISRMAQQQQESCSSTNVATADAATGAGKTAYCDTNSGDVNGEDMELCLGGNSDGYETPAPADAGEGGGGTTIAATTSRRSRTVDGFLSEAAEAAAADRRDRGRCPINARTPWKFWLVFLSLGAANSSDAAEILCLSYILSQPAFRESILLETAWRGGLLAAAVFFGMLVGGLLVGALGDWQGRRPLLLVGLATNCFSGMLSALATNVWMLSLLRLIAGIGIGSTVPPLFTLCSELSPPADRGFWVTVAASFWMVGSLYVALVGWWILGGTETEVEDALSGSSAPAAIPAWRIFAAVCAVPSALGWLMVSRYVPESHRYLALQGRYEEAAVSIRRLCDALNYTSGRPLSRQEIEEQYAMVNNVSAIDEHEENGNIEACASAPPSSPTESLNRQHQRRRQPLSIRLVWYEFRTSTSLLYSTHELSRTSLSLQMVWFSLSFGSYGLLTWINTLFEQVHLKNVYFNALLFASANLPGNLLSAYLMDRMGRARLLVGSVLASAASLLVFAYVAAVDEVVDGDSTAKDGEGDLPVPRGWIVFAACSFQCFSISAWNAIDVLTSELFPTTVRATGMGICAASGRIGAMLAQGVNGALVARPVRLLLVSATTLLLGAVTPAFLPEDATGQSVQDRVVDNSNKSTGNSTATAATESIVIGEKSNERRRSSSELHQDYSSGAFVLQEMNEVNPGPRPDGQALQRPYSYQPVAPR